MMLGEAPVEQLQHWARTEGIRFKTGPVPVRLVTDIPQLVSVMQNMYGPLPLLGNDRICQFHIRIRRARGPRRWLRPQAVFSINGRDPFEPYPLDHALPLFEWGLNWCIGTTAHNNLMLHSAAVEKNGVAVLLPAIPGSGKTTLCAGLITRGWRLLSDEFGIVRHSDGHLLPIPRAAPLKNDSIDIIKDYAPDAGFGPRYEGTRKGTVTHLAPPRESLIRQEETAVPRFIVFPRYQKGQPTQLTALAKSVAFTRLTNNAFNYQITMEKGFASAARLVKSTHCYQLISGDLNEAVQRLQRLVEGE